MASMSNMLNMYVKAMQIVERNVIRKIPQCFKPMPDNCVSSKLILFSKESEEFLSSKLSALSCSLENSGLAQRFA